MSTPAPTMKPRPTKYRPAQLPCCTGWRGIAKDRTVPGLWRMREVHALDCTADELLEDAR